MAEYPSCQQCGAPMNHSPKRGGWYCPECRMVELENELSTLHHDLRNEQAASRMAHEVVARNKALEAENAELKADIVRLKMHLESAERAAKANGDAYNDEKAENAQLRHALGNAQVAAGFAKEMGEKVKALQAGANVSGWLATLIAHMEEGHDFWCPVAVVELEQTDDRHPLYTQYPHCRIKGDESRRLYLFTDNEEPFGHYYVWQTTGCCEDDYSGWLLFPLPDGKYLQVSYSC